MTNCIAKCPKCRVPCVPRGQLGLNDSSICIVNAPGELMECYDDKDELRMRIWANMRPPKISDPTPVINAERLEKLRQLLGDGKVNDDEAVATRIESYVAMEITEDGLIQKTISRKEIKWYRGDEDEDEDKEDELKDYCLPDCTKASEDEVKELFRRHKCESIPSFSKRECS